METYTYEETRHRTRGNRFRQFPSAVKGRARFLPYARPAIKGAELAAAASFYALGACFARGIEKALRSANRAVLSSPTGQGLPGSTSEQFQRYNIFNLDVALNELIWALTTTSAGIPKALLPIDGKLADTQLNWTFAHEPETAREFRTIYNSSYARVLDADVVILTTGGIEQWFDNEHQIYINSMPGPVADGLYPGRFELRRIGVDEAEQTLQNIISLIRAHSRRNPLFYIAVSPVSQPVVFGPDDILVDQFYAKTVQRQAVERVVQDDAGCYYLPALEAAMWSDFQYNYLESSMNHTTQNFASRVVSDMLEAGGAQDASFKAHRATAHGTALLGGGNTAEAIALCEEVLGEDIPGDELDENDQGEVDSVYLHALVRAHRRNDAFSHAFKRLRSGKSVPLMLNEIASWGDGFISSDQKNEALEIASGNDGPVERLTALRVKSEAAAPDSAPARLVALSKVFVSKDYDTAVRLGRDIFPDQADLQPRGQARLFQMLIRSLEITEQYAEALELSLTVMHSEMCTNVPAFNAAERVVRFHASKEQLEEIVLKLRSDYPEVKSSNLEKALSRRHGVTL